MISIIKLCDFASESSPTASGLFRSGSTETSATGCASKAAPPSCLYPAPNPSVHRPTLRSLRYNLSLLDLKFLFFPSPSSSFMRFVLTLGSPMSMSGSVLFNYWMPIDERTSFSYTEAFDSSIEFLPPFPFTILLPCFCCVICDPSLRSLCFEFFILLLSRSCSSIGKNPSPLYPTPI